MKLGTETGSLMSHVMTNSKQAEPVVGMGATLCGWPDRHAGTVVEILSARRIVVQQDTATRTDKGGMSDQQTYDYAPNPNGSKHTFFLTKHGTWKESKGGCGYRLVLGTRREYYDFSQPVVGMGATLCGWSDRHAGTVVEILSARRIVVQQDTAVRTDTNGMSESQTYSYTPNPNGTKHTFFLSKSGRWKESKGRCGYGLVLGTRMEYYDFSF